ncbi:hypothetical protein ABID14_001600 [Peptoniphilus olsenii]|uniref:Uncharacterized protein n=1 Tax=Peptoniphilus olsenii TaxID=411570 RepID=A0ABV2JAX8_9FIRM
MKKRFLIFISLIFCMFLSPVYANNITDINNNEISSEISINHDNTENNITNEKNILDSNNDENVSVNNTQEIVNLDDSKSDDIDKKDITEKINEESSTSKSEEIITELEDNPKPDNDTFDKDKLSDDADNLKFEQNDNKFISDFERVDENNDINTDLRGKDYSIQEDDQVSNLEKDTANDDNLKEDKSITFKNLNVGDELSISAVRANEIDENDGQKTVEVDSMDSLLDAISKATGQVKIIITKSFDVTKKIVIGKDKDIILTANNSKEADKSGNL